MGRKEDEQWALKIQGEPLQVTLASPRLAGHLLSAPKPKIVWELAWTERGRM